MIYPTIIQCMETVDKMDKEYYDDLSELILFYWENKDRNPDIKMAEA